MASMPMWPDGRDLEIQRADSTENAQPRAWERLRSSMSSSGCCPFLQPPQRQQGNSRQEDASLCPSWFPLHSQFVRPSHCSRPSRDSRSSECNVYACVRTNRRDEAESERNELQIERDSAKRQAALADEKAHEARDRARTLEKELAVEREKAQQKEHELRALKDSEGEMARQWRAAQEENAKVNRHVKEVTLQRDDAITNLEHMKQNQDRPFWKRLTCLKPIYRAVTFRTSLKQPCCSVCFEGLLRRQETLTGLRPQTLGARRRLDSIGGLGFNSPGSHGKQRPVVDFMNSSSNGLDALAEVADIGAMVANEDTERTPELINLFIQTEWQFISEWFEMQMRNSVMPMLQEQSKTWDHGLSLLTPSIRTEAPCNLGRNPIVLEDIETKTYMEAVTDGTGNIKNMQIRGRINYHGDGIIDIHVADRAGFMTGNLIMTGLEVEGEIVIELVKLTQAPPWFSGVRIFFTNRPRVELTTLTPHLYGITMNVEIIKTKIVQAVGDKVIEGMATLPNRVAIPIGGPRMEEFSLKFPRPQGILRMVVLRAKDLPRAIRDENSWLQKWKASSIKNDIDPIAVVKVGTESYSTCRCQQTNDPTWSEFDVYDFLVQDVDRQTLQITVKDLDYGLTCGKSSDILATFARPLNELANNARVQCANLQPRGELFFRAQWRPFAEEHMITGEYFSADNEWSFGDKYKNHWLLAADILYASGLPDCEDGTEHWATFTVTSAEGESSTPQETGASIADKPITHGARMLNSVGLDPELTTEKERAAIGRGMWRKKIMLGAVASELEQKGRTLRDVVWDCPKSLMMSRPTQSQDTMVKIRVWRPLKGKTRPSENKAGDRVLIGSVEERINMVRLGPKMSIELHCPLLGGEGQETGASIKFRLRALRLLPPESKEEVKGLVQQAIELVRGTGGRSPPRSPPQGSGAGGINGTPGVERSLSTNGAELEAAIAEPQINSAPLAPSTPTWFGRLFASKPEVSAPREQSEAPTDGTAEPAPQDNTDPADEIAQPDPEPIPRTQSETLPTGVDTSAEASKAGKDGAAQDAFGVVGRFRNWVWPKPASPASGASVNAQGDSELPGQVETADSLPSSPSSLARQLQMPSLDTSLDTSMDTSPTAREAEEEASPSERNVRDNVQVSSEAAAAVKEEATATVQSTEVVAATEEAGAAIVEETEASGATSPNSGKVEAQATVVSTTTPSFWSRWAPVFTRRPSPIIAEVEPAPEEEKEEGESSSSDPKEKKGESDTSSSDPIPLEKEKEECDSSSSDPFPVERFRSCRWESNRALMGRSFEVGTEQGSTNGIDEVRSRLEERYDAFPFMQQPLLDDSTIAAAESSQTAHEAKGKDEPRNRSRSGARKRSCERTRSCSGERVRKRSRSCERTRSASGERQVAQVEAGKDELVQEQSNAGSAANPNSKPDFQGCEVAVAVPQLDIPLEAVLDPQPGPSEEGSSLGGATPASRAEQSEAVLDPQPEPSQEGHSPVAAKPDVRSRFHTAVDTELEHTEEVPLSPERPVFSGEVDADGQQPSPEARQPGSTDARFLSTDSPVDCQEWQSPGQSLDGSTTHPVVEPELEGD